MFFEIVLIILSSTILCYPYPENISELFKEHNVTNLTEISNKLNSYEKEFYTLYKRARRLEEMVCDNMEKNIKSLEEIKNKYSSFEQILESGKIKNSEFKEFFDIRGNMMFGKRNIEIAIDRLNKTKKNCFPDYEALAKYNKEKIAKNQKSQEEIIKTFNQILNMENGL